MKVRPLRLAVRFVNKLVVPIGWVFWESTDLRTRLQTRLTVVSREEHEND